MDYCYTVTPTPGLLYICSTVPNSVTLTTWVLPFLIKTDSYGYRFTYSSLPKALRLYSVVSVEKQCLSFSI